MSSAVLPLTPVRKGLISEPFDNPAGIRLLGSKCGTCAEVSFGTNPVCLNCGGNDIRSVQLSPEGVLWTFTVVRHKPPGDYRGPQPFVPFGLGLIELPEGIRIMAPLEGDVNSFRVGARMRLKLQVLGTDSSAPLAAFSFVMIE
jgi:uncharacterized protein